MNAAFFLAEGIADIDISTVGGKLNMGLQTTLLGMLIVFLVLAILFICLKLFKLLFHDIPSAMKRKTSSAPIVSSAPVVQQNDEEIVAAITAAIMAAQNDEGGAKIRVVSFKRIG